MRGLPVSLLRSRDFRCLGLAMVLSSAGMMAETVVLGWLALELTNSPLMVGVAMGMRAIPLLLVGVPAGVIADRVPRHRLLMATTIGQALTAATIGVLALLGVVRLPHILVLTFAAGAIRGIEQAARQSYAHDIVGATDLMKGFAALAVASRVGWLLGSLGAGAFIARLGPGVTYLAVAAGYLLGAAALLPARAPAGTAPPAPGSAWQSFVGFLSTIRRDRVLPVLIALTAGAEILGFSHQALLPSLARDVLRVGPQGLGAMSAARSIGGILGIVAVSALGPAQGGGALLLATLVSFGAALVVLGLAPHFAGFLGVLVILVVVNSLGALSDLFAQSLIQLSAPSHLRGRAGGAWVLGIGLGPLGQLQIGALASLFGVSVALATSGLGLVALAGASAWMFPRIRRL